MRKSELRSGMVIEYRNGEKRICLDLGNERRLVGEKKQMHFCNYNDDLLYTGYTNDYDIVKVYKTSAIVIEDFFKEEYLTLMWTRESEEKVKLRETIDTLKQQLKDAENKLNNI